MLSLLLSLAALAADPAAAPPPPPPAPPAAPVPTIGGEAPVEPAPAAEPEPAAEPPGDGVAPPPPPPAPPPAGMAPPPPAGLPPGETPPASAPTGAITTTGAPPITSGAGLDDKKFQFTFGGVVQYDLRFRPVKYEYGDYYRDVEDPRTLSRNELMAKFRFGGKLAKFGMKGDVDFYIRAYPKSETLQDQTEYNKVNPFRFEMHELYLYARDLFGARGLDLKMGQQKVMHGVGDQFNPTNTVNANDLEDILLFGDQQGNLMVRLDYTPVWNFTLTGVLVPVFKGALLPDTSHLAQTPDRYPFLSDELRYNLAAEQAYAAAQPSERFANLDIGTYPTVVNNVFIEQPEFTPKNMQVFFRAGASLGGQDLALSYYNGRSDIPQAVYNLVSQTQAPVCEDPNNPDGRCVDGLLLNDVTLTYPKIQVLGFNMTGEMNPFGKIHKSFKSIGYRFELGVYFPQETRLVVEQDNVTVTVPLLGEVVKDGEYAYPNGDNRVSDKRPFAKWVLGLDYQFNRFLYMNTQWVHGMVDEFGAGDWIQPGYAVRGSGADVSRIGTEDCPMDLGTFAIEGSKCASEWLKPKLSDYLVWGTDLRLAQGSFLIRLFTIWDLTGVYKSEWDVDAGERVLTKRGLFTKDGFSAVIYPALQYNFGNGLELHGGALVQLGKPWSKFGAPETGGHQIWLRARYSY